MEEKGKIAKIEKMDKRVFGFFVVGVASLIGGIFIFAFIVVPQRRPETGVPRDVQLVFTELFSQQSVQKNATGKFSPALNLLGVDQETCRRFECQLTVDPSGEEYIFRLSKGGQRWFIQSKSPVPEEMP